jgi:hypothetical protein
MSTLLQTWKLTVTGMTTGNGTPLKNSPNEQLVTLVKQVSFGDGANVTVIVF